MARLWQIGWDTLKIRPERETAANKSTRGECQDSYLASRCCAAIRRRSRCGPVRGWPVLSWHFSPGAAPHVGQATASIFCAVSSFFIAEEEYFKPSGRVCTLAHHLEGSGERDFPAAGANADVPTKPHKPCGAGRRADLTSQGRLDTARRMKRLRLPYRLVPCQKRAGRR
jgi:hypothetical protein